MAKSITFLAPASPGVYRREKLFNGFLLVAAGLVVVTLAAIMAILLASGIGAFQKYGLGFLTSTDWDPVRDLYGALVPIVGTLATAFIAMLLAWPIGFGAAYFLTEICPRPLREPLGIAVELLAAIPSIVYGMWGFFVLAPYMSEKMQPFLTSILGFIPPSPSAENPVWWWFQGAPVGVGLLCAGLVLAIMVLPFIVATTREILLQAPQSLKDGAFALGATRWESITQIVVPAVRGSLFGAVFLGLGRALGETMAVTFVIGNATRLPDSFYAPTTSIAALIANSFPEAEPGSMKLAALFALGFLLFVISFVVLAVARVLLRQGKMV